MGILRILNKYGVTGREQPSVEENITVDSFIDSHNQWNTNLLRLVVPQNIINDICDIPIPLNNILDEFFWGYSNNGDFTTKSASWLAQGLEHQFKSKCGFHWICNLNLPPKQKSFLWNLCVNGLPTKERLQQSHVFIP